MLAKRSNLWSWRDCFGASPLTMTSNTPYYHRYIDVLEFGGIIVGNHHQNEASP